MRTDVGKKVCDFGPAQSSQANSPFIHRKAMYPGRFSRYWRTVTESLWHIHEEELYILATVKNWCPAFVQGTKYLASNNS